MMQLFTSLHPSTTRSNFTSNRELVGARPLHLACARPFGRLKAPLGLSLLRFAAQTRTTLFLLCTKSCIVWRKIDVWRSFRWKFVKRKSLKLLVTSRSFRLCFAQIGNLLVDGLHRGDYEYVTNCITFNLVVHKHMRYHYKNIEQTRGYTSAQYFALLFF